MTIEQIKNSLPLPSTCPTEHLRVPLGVYGFDENGVPEYGEILFQKDYIDGICIGWKIIEK